MFCLICREISFPLLLNFLKRLKSTNSFYLGLGSNEGDRLAFLQQAVEEIHQEIGRISAVSSVYQTPAMGFSGKDFLNACVRVESRFSPEKVLRLLLEIEQNLGRVRQNSGYQNRNIDVDILLYEEEVVESETLKIPHPQMLQRNFVLFPLMDIAAEEKHPLKNQKIKDIFETAEMSSEITRIPQDLKKPKEPDFTGRNYVAVEGNIGAGKTSFSTMISEDYNARLILERFMDNSFLPKFYEDKARFAFPLEMSFLADRYQQLSDDVAQYDLFKDFVISDYDVFKSLIFAKVTLQEEEYKLYHKLFTLMYKELVKPDLYVYLYQNTERLLENIKKRGRIYEQNIEAEYLAEINKSYLSFIKSQPSLNVKVLDISELDFVENRRDYLKLVHQVLEDPKR